jgi:hypothetical protein
LFALEQVRANEFAEKQLKRETAFYVTKSILEGVQETVR